MARTRITPHPHVTAGYLTSMTDAEIVGELERMAPRDEGSARGRLMREAAKRITRYREYMEREKA